MSGVEDFGSTPLDGGDRPTASSSGLADLSDNGRAPEGMQTVVQDDSEGEEGKDKAANAGSEAGEGDEDEDDDEEGEDEDEDEDDEDEEEEEERSQRPRKKKRRMRANKYVDLEVEVDEDEEEEEDEGEAGFEAADDYLERPGTRAIPIADRFEGDDEDLDDNDRNHRQLERRARDREEAEALRIAEEYKQRHRQRRGGMGIQAMQDFAPRSVLMPGVNDPNIWCIKCKIGRERELIMSISRKAIAQNLQISSAFQRDSFHGHLYIEARSEAHVRQAVEGLIGVYVSNVPVLVNIEEMPDLLKSRKKQIPLAVNGWVRIKKGIYRGDIAQIDDVPESTDYVTLKVVPRIEMHPKEDHQDSPSLGSGPGKKRRRQEQSSLFRPPPKLFNAEEVRTAYGSRGKVVKDSEGHHFQNELYVDGFLIKDFRMHMIDRENVNPTIDEIDRFKKDARHGAGLDGAAGDGIDPTNSLDLSMVKNAARAQTVLQPGDFVEIYEGSQKGIAGTVETISNNVIFLAASEPEDLRGTTIEVLADQVRKKFKSGDHIKVLRGKNVNESGLVLKIKDDLVTFLSDLSMEEITVFSRDIREAAEVGAAAAAFGQYELHDLIQLDNETVGIIFKIEPDAFRILDQSGAVRTLRPSQIGNKLDTRMSVATDRDNYELRAGDQVKEFQRGNMEPRTGTVLHVWRSLFTFLHNRDVLENGGVFVTYAKSLVSVAPKGNSNKFGNDLSKMNPSIGGSAAMQSGMMGNPAPVGRIREVAIGANVVVVKGNHKGLKGIIKDLNGPLARVELHTRMRTITIERNKLGVDQGGSIMSLEEWERDRSRNRRNDAAGFGVNAVSPMNARRGPQSTAGSQTPMYGTGGYSTGKTPMHRGGATPFGGSFGGATPFGGSATPFGAGGATPYNSGKTPAYGGGGDAFAASSRTPYAGSGGNAFSASSRTPYAGNAGSSSNAWGSATPYSGTSGASGSGYNAAWGSASASPGPNGPARNANGNAAWGSASPAYAPTASASRVSAANDAWASHSAAPESGAAWGSEAPGGNGPSAPKGSHLSAPSPWASEGADATPYASAPTPAAQTPYASAPTPAVQDDSWDTYDSAPTPAANAATPYQSAATPAEY